MCTSVRDLQASTPQQAAAPAVLGPGVPQQCWHPRAGGLGAEGEGIPVSAVSRAAGHLRSTKAWRGPALFSPPDPTSMIEGAGVLEEEKPASLAA